MKKRIFISILCSVLTVLGIMGSAISCSAAETETDAPRSLDQSEPEETDDPNARDYVLNKNTMKFHKPSCSSVGDIKPENRWDFHGTREEVLDMGYVPCKRCKP